MFNFFFENARAELFAELSDLLSATVHLPFCELDIDLESCLCIVRDGFNTARGVFTLCILERRDESIVKLFMRA